MTLLDDTGRTIQLHPLVRAMIELLALHQSLIVKRGCGTIELNFGPMASDVKVYDRPVVIGKIDTKDKPRPA